MAKKSDFNTSRSVKDLQAEYGKMPPQAVDLEEAVLGALMLERDAFSIVGDLLEPDAFYKDKIAKYSSKRKENSSSVEKSFRLEKSNRITL